MGWVIAIGLALAVLAALLVARLPRMAWEVSAAALLFGLAGYAWQGHPDYAGVPRTGGENKAPFDEKLAEQRRSLGERYGKAGQWLVMSDAYGRRGHTQEAANVLVAGLRATPDDASLWLGLGNALVAHGDGVLSPSADYAYRRALALDPEGPAPRFFYGLAAARAGELPKARALWVSLADSVPQDTPLRAELNANIARIDQMLSRSSTATR